MINRLSLSYSFKSFDWNKEIVFDDPIKKDEIKYISQAMALARDIFLAIDRKEIYRMDDYKIADNIYFRMAGENILGAAIYYFCKYIKKEYCNLAYIVAFLCQEDDEIFVEVLKKDPETSIHVRSYGECRKNDAISQYQGIRSTLDTYLGQLYSKEFFYLSLNGKWNPNVYDCYSCSDLFYNNILNRVSFDIKYLMENDCIEGVVEEEKKKLFENPFADTIEIIHIAKSTDVDGDLNNEE